MTTMDDPRLWTAIERRLRRYVRAAIVDAVPGKAYGLVRSVPGDGTIGVELDGSDGVVTPGAWLGEVVPLVGQRVRVLRWPDGDTFVDAVLAPAPPGLVPSVAALPAAGVESAGRLYRVPGGTGVADQVHVCRKKADDTWEWAQLTV